MPRVGVVEQPDHGARHLGQKRIDEVEIVNSLPGVGPDPDGHYQIPAIVGDVNAEAPVGLIEPLVHQNIVGLDGPDPMVVDLHVPILAHHGLAGPGLGIARVEEALAVPGPGGARKLDPAKMVAQIDTVGHPADFEFLPIRSARGDPIEQEVPVGTWLGQGQGYGPIARKS